MGGVDIPLHVSLLPRWPIFHDGVAQRRTSTCPCAMAARPRDGRLSALVAMSVDVVAWYAACAALAAALGPPLVRALGVDDPRVGIADALAAGAMLGVAYPLFREALEAGSAAASLGAVVLVLLLLAVHVAFDIDGVAATSARNAFLAGAVHAAPEGVALGVACALDPRFGAVVAGTLALHNVGEGMALGARLHPVIGGARTPWAAVIANAPQVALGVAAYAACVRFPAWQSALAGAAAAALVYLALADLLPDGYRTAGRTAISVTVIVATSVVVFAGALP